MQNSMCFRVHVTSISTGFFLYFRELFTSGFYTSEDRSPSGFIFQRNVHPQFLYFRELFTRGFYISVNCSSPVFIFQRTVYPRFSYFRELFTPGFYIAENCSSPVFIFQRTVHPRFLYFRELFTPGLQWIREITKLPNSEQSYKGKVKTHNYINRQYQSTIGKL